MSSENKKKLVSAILQRDLSDMEMQFILEDWKAFYDEPVKYSGTVVVKLVNEYLDGFRLQDEQQNMYTGAQSVMEQDMMDFIDFCSQH